MSGFDARLRAFGRRRYDAPRAGSFVVLCCLFVVGGAVLAVVQVPGAGLGYVVVGAAGVLACELVGRRRRRQRGGV